MKKISLFVAATALCFASESIAAQKKLALLVGIDDYIAVNHLHGCVNDVRDIRDLLRTTYEFDDANIIVLTNAQATHANIIAKFRSHLINRAAPGDIVVFHYSGHGSRMPDVSDELEGMDETIVPVDSRQAEIFDISDKELNILLRELETKTKNITVILDSCHSGTGVRADGIRQIPDDTRTPSARPNASRGVRNGASGMKELGLDYVLIAAARPKELANESLTPEGEERGALTYSLTRILRGMSGPLTVRELMEEVSSDVCAHFPSQHPQAEGLGIDKEVFGATERPVTAHFLVSPTATGAIVQGGVTSGLATGAAFDVYRPRTRDFTIPPIAKLRLTAVRATDADAQVTAGSVQPLSRAILRSNPLTPSRLRLHYDPSAGALADLLKTDLTTLQGFTEVQQITSADLVLRKSPDGVAFYTPDLVQVSPSVSPTALGSLSWLVKQASDWARWFQILGIRNPAPQLTVDVSVRKVGTDGKRDLVEGDDLEVVTHNTSNQDLFITMVDLSNDGSVDSWYPPAGIQEALGPGRELKRTFSMRVAPGRRASVDIIKVFATSDWIDPNVFRLIPIRAIDTVQARGNALESFIAARLQGARPGMSVEMKGWTTREQAVTIHKNPVRLTNFIAHYDGAVASLTATRAALPDCAANRNAACYEVRALDPDGATVEIIPGGVRGENDAADSATAWDEAYKIRDAISAARVEPSLEYELDQFSPDIKGTRGGMQRPDKQRALANNVWSLQHANVFEAWRLLQKSGRADGEEAKGIVIGHPDTGYRRHPEIWNSDPGKSPVVASSGWNYVENSSDARDPLDNSGLFPNPGHGTKSSSVIISPKGQQLIDAAHPERFVDGAAPGARLVPLRVHRSVVHFNPAHLARAIYDASSDDRTRVKQKADVISISMGGVPSWALWKAVRYAESRGVIVVAAAGNEVGFVVWPARFDQTVAVAASNVDCGIWDGSARGPAVDITAPGESVWHAESDPDGTDSIALGQGTTFATATTAGVAALWLDYHRNDPAMAELRSRGEVTAAFRNALQAAAWRPDRPPPTWPANVQCTDVRPWSSGQLGPGIVDAAKTLVQPLSTSRAPTRTSLDQLPLFATIFSPDSAIIADRYAAIFGVTRADFGKVAPFEAEVMQQYAMSDEVRNAIDTIVVLSAPTAEQFQTIRRALQAQSISSRLRAALRPSRQ